MMLLMKVAFAFLSSTEHQKPLALFADWHKIGKPGTFYSAIGIPERSVLFPGHAAQKRQFNEKHIFKQTK